MKKILHKIWLFSGGDKLEDLFRLLSSDIINNRRLIAELRKKQVELDQRMWDLEGHSDEENLERSEKIFENIKDTLKDLQSEL